MISAPPCAGVSCLIRDKWMNELVDIVQIIAQIPVVMDTVGLKCELKLIVFIRFSMSFSIRMVVSQYFFLLSFTGYVFSDIYVTFAKCFHKRSHSKICAAPVDITEHLGLCYSWVWCEKHLHIIPVVFSGSRLAQSVQLYLTTVWFMKLDDESSAAAALTAVISYYFSLYGNTFLI